MVVYRKDVSNEIYLYEPVSPQAGAVRVGLMYPASYQIAMSSLGYLTLFQQLDRNPHVDARRIYADTLEENKSFSMELMGFSFSFELDTLKILESLQAYQIPFYAEQRDRSHPLVFAGGPVPMSNPEPFAAFFDFFLIGEGEEILEDLVTAYNRYRDVADRQELIHKLAAEVPGLYAPSMYEVTYQSPEGPIASITPKYSDIPFPVQKRFISNMDDFVASSPIISDKAIFSSTLLVEVMRGCAHRCRFCLASYSMLPARGGAASLILDKIEEGTQYTHKVGLLGALISNHPNFPEICDYLDHKMDQMPELTVSASSLRADTMTPQIARTFKKGKQNQLTIAVETGSEKLRRRINKNLKHEDILKAASIVAESGLKGLKIYGMVGLPDEDDQDVEDLATLMKDLRRENPKLELHLGCSSFVPKAGTPFQWMEKLDNKTIEARFNILRKALLKVADVRASSTKWDFFQAFLSRGDRRLAPLLVRFFELGGSLGSVNRAYKELQEEGKVNFPGLEWYAQRQRPEDEILPWDTINLGVAKEILYKEGLPPVAVVS